MPEIFTPYSKTILELFGGSVYYQIPSYQRPYSWKSEQVEALWKDIFDSFEENEDEYFLGSVIMTRTRDNKYYDVVDGQQRMTTLMILFCSLRDLYYANLSDSKRRNLVLGRIKNLETDAERLQLRTQNQHQNKFEQEILQKIDFTKNWTSSELDTNNFLNAAHIFKEKIVSLLDSNPSKLEGFTNYLLERVRVITIECSDQSSAIKLFQVLNSRGMDLTSADLIKSYLMSRLKVDDIPIFESDWIRIESKAKELGETINDLLTYYEYYLLGTNPKRSLHKELEICFKSRDPKEVIYEFNKLIDYFYDIDSENSKLVYSLMYLRHDVYWKSILITAKMESWSNEDIISLEKMLRKFYYLYWIAEYTTSKTKQTSFNIITAIKNKQTIQQIVNELETKIKDDQVIGRALANLRGNIYGYSWCKPLLMLIEYQQTDNTSFTYMDLDKFVHVEHILPQGYDKISYWNKLFPQGVADEYVDTLGNLTLLSGKKNIEASNKPFPEKLHVYKGKGIDGATGYRITQDIFDSVGADPNWTVERIYDRCNWLLREIGKLLEIDPYQEIFIEDEEEITESAQELYDSLHKKILGLGSDVKFEPKKYYVAFKRKTNFLTAELQRNKIKVWFDYDKSLLDDSRGIIRDVSEIGHHGTGDLEIELTSLDDIEYTLPFIKKAYEQNETLSESDGKETVYDESHILDMSSNRQMHELLYEFRRALKNITVFTEKINRNYVGFKNSTNNFAVFRLRNKFCYISVQDVGTNPDPSDTNLEYYEKYRELYIKIATKDDIEKYLPLVKLSAKYKV